MRYNFVEQPKSHQSSLDGVLLVTNNYLIGFIGSSSLSQRSETLTSFSTEIEEDVTDSSPGTVAITVTYASVATFDEAHGVPSVGILDDIIVTSFSGTGLVTYTGLVETLPEMNAFRTAISVEFIVNPFVANDFNPNTVKEKSKREGTNLRG
jgi:hypothetical protein